MSSKSFLVLVSLAVLAFSCQKSGPSNNGGVVIITSFSFLKASNQTPVDAIASINGQSINIFLPPGTNLRTLAASYTLSDSAVVSVNGEPQQSGVSRNNFSAPLTYTVTSKSGGIQNYTVNLTTDLLPLDQDVAGFMKTYSIPGLSMAITQNDKLVYVKSYGFADTAALQPTTNLNLFRISALSKQVTSAAIMRLMDQGKISLNDKVFGPGAILGTTYGSQPYGQFLLAVTVGDLLHHTEGGWPFNNNDPMNQQPSLTVDQLVGWGVDNVQLTNSPGTAYAYSHFGYCVLGRVIEKITGLPYQQAVQSLILQPSGIADMQIAQNGVKGRLPNEVTYYDQSGNNQAYTFNINRMDATNGWVASATDLARFLAHVDGLSSLSILSNNAVNTMITGSVANPKYGCGWELNEFNWYHHGTLPGTGASQAVTTQAGNFNYVILTNSANSSPNFSNDMDNIFWNALPNIPSWPNYDLF